MAISVDDERAVLLSFELDAIWERFNDLKKLDSGAMTRVAKLFGFLLLYAAAPFSLETIFTSDFLCRLWGIGGLWLALTGWFICDRDFRAYGAHLKERIFCLRQIAMLRHLVMRDDAVYLTRTLSAVGGFSRRGEERGSGFPEYMSPTQFAVASYFFKFISLFPLAYLYVFVGMILFPSELLGTGEQLSWYGLLRLVLAGSFIIFFWLWAGAIRCVQLQEEVFTARRIRSDRPWPVFPKERAQKVLRYPREILLIVLKFSMYVVSALALVWVVAMWTRHGTIEWVWSKWDVALFSLNIGVAAVAFVFFEYDIRAYLRAAKKVDPVTVDDTPQAALESDKLEQLALFESSEVDDQPLLVPVSTSAVDADEAN